MEDRMLGGGQFVAGLECSPKGFWFCSENLGGFELGECDNVIFIWKVWSVMLSQSGVMPNMREHRALAYQRRSSEHGQHCARGLSNLVCGLWMPFSKLPCTSVSKDCTFDPLSQTDPLVFGTPMSTQKREQDSSGSFVPQAESSANPGLAGTRRWKSSVSWDATLRCTSHCRASPGHKDEAVSG